MGEGGKMLMFCCNHPDASLWTKLNEDRLCVEKKQQKMISVLL